MECFLKVGGNIYFPNIEKFGNLEKFEDHAYCIEGYNYIFLKG